LAFKAHRVTTGLARGCALLLGTALITSCAPPQYTYVTDSGDSTYFKVPHYWQEVTPSSLCAELEKESGASTCPTGWSIAYEADHDPSAVNFLADNLKQPFVFSEVEPYTSQTGAALTTEQLQDFFLPFTAEARESDALSGFPLTNFVQLRDATIKLNGGFYGYRETYQYTFPDGNADTFDQDVLTNSAGTTIYFLVLHCTTSCYSQDQSVINDIVSSFTVRSN
jgi:hypothetical protein